MKTIRTVYPLLCALIVNVVCAAPDAALSVKVRIIGQVNAPADYEVAKTELNLHALILRAGGPTQAARWGQGVTIIRKVDGHDKKLFHKIEIFQLLKEGPESKLNIPIEPSDTVFIMERVL